MSDERAFARAYKQMEGVLNDKETLAAFTRAAFPGGEVPTAHAPRRAAIEKTIIGNYWRVTRSSPQPHNDVLDKLVDMVDAKLMAR
jgi:hypothetical protein